LGDAHRAEDDLHADQLQRDELISRRLQATADELCDGTLSSLISHLVKSKKFTSSQRRRLRDMLDEM
jgi:predicted transcriptional regulator